MTQTLLGPDPVGVFNVLGADGWELCAVDPGRLTAWLKRNATRWELAQQALAHRAKGELSELSNSSDAGAAEHGKRKRR